MARPMAPPRPATAILKDLLRRQVQKELQLRRELDNLVDLLDSLQPNAGKNALVELRAEAEKK